MVPEILRVPFGGFLMQSTLDDNFLGEIVTSHKLFWIAWKTDGSKKPM